MILRIESKRLTPVVIGDATIILLQLPILFILMLVLFLLFLPMVLQLPLKLMVIGNFPVNEIMAAAVGFDATKTTDTVAGFLTSVVVVNAIMDDIVIEIEIAVS